MPGQLNHELYFWGPHVIANGTGEQEPQAEVMGGGTAADPIVGSSGKNFQEWRCRSDDAAGDIRGLYLRTYYAGGAGGDCARIFSTVQEDCGTVHGAHISLNYTDGKQTSGQGIAMRATLHVPDESLGGLAAAVEAELYCDGGSADVSNGAFLYCNADGNATGVASLDDNAYLLNVQGLTAGAAHLFRTGLTAATVNAATTAALRVKVGDTDYFIPLATATT
jgi:hypothetical protein